MSDLLDRYGEQWRAAQPIPAAVVLTRLRDRRRWPIVAVVLVIAAAVGAGFAAQLTDRAASKPAVLITNPSPSTRASTALPPRTCTATDLTIGRAVTSGKTTSVQLTARTACTLTGPSLVATPQLRTGTPPVQLRVGAVADVEVVDSTGQGCERLDQPAFAETVTLGTTVLIGIRLRPAACGDYLYSKLASAPGSVPTARAAQCQAKQLYGSVDGQATANGFTYELALTNTSSTSCQLTGQPLSVQGLEADGSAVTVVAPRLSGPFQNAHLTGPAAPGEPEHLLLYGLNGCASGTGLTVTTLRLYLPTGSVDIPATGADNGLLQLQCSPRLSDFYGPVSTLVNAEPPALPAGLPCTAAQLRIDAVTHDYVLRAKPVTTSP